MESNSTAGVPTEVSNPIAQAIIQNKELRVRIQDIINSLRGPVRGSAERTLAFRCLQQARHWLGEDLAVLNEQTPYVNADNPANIKVDPRADVPSSGPTGGATLTVGPEDFGGQDYPDGPWATGWAERSSGGGQISDART